MNNVRRNLARLSRRQKIVAGATAALVLLTWLAACLVAIWAMAGLP